MTTRCFPYRSALEMYARRHCVRRYPSWDFRDHVVVHCAEAFEVSEASIYVCGVCLRCYQATSYCSCYVTHDSLLIWDHSCANVGRHKEQLLSFLCVEIVLSEFFFFCVPLPYHTPFDSFFDCYQGMYICVLVP